MDILLLSHGNFASGLKSSAELITGENKNIHALDLYLDNEKLDAKLKKLREAHPLDEENLIVLTDIQGGSVTQQVIGNFDLNKVQVVTGMNLPLLLSLITSGMDTLDKKGLNEMIEISKDSVLSVNDFLEQAAEEDF